MQFANNNLVRIVRLLNEQRTAEEVVAQGQKAYRLQKNQLKAITTTFILEYFQKQQKSLIEKTLEKPTAYSEGEQNWHPNQLKIFTWVLLLYAHLQSKSLLQFKEADIVAIRELFATKTLNFIRYHHLFICKSATRQNRCEWQHQEVQLLTDIIHSYCFERKWSDIAYELYCRSGLAYFKTSHQCREKWFNHLNPALSKEKWTIEEDIILFKNARDLGTKWAKISKAMGECRTEHMIKNRFKSIAKKYENRFQRCTVRKRIQNILKDLELKSLTMKEKEEIENNENQIKEQANLSSEDKGPDSLETIKEEEAIASTHGVETVFTHSQNQAQATFNKISSIVFENMEYEHPQQRYDFVYDEGIIINLRQSSTPSNIMLIDYLNMDFDARNRTKTIFSGSVE